MVLEDLVIWVAFAHIGLPALLALALMIFSAASTRDPLTWDLAPNVAFEMTILSSGATAAIFENPNVAASYGVHAPTMAIGVVAFNLVLAGIIVLIRRYFFPPPTHPRRWAAFTLGLGGMALFITSFSLLYGAYRSIFGF